uniref:t-SNARE coiled-coil homology domain-containing protein n=1 Tax=Rhodosorus marinus TaxID=101924 RepID=A0A7S2ZV56_9RHOD|mmetsp:Transcript_33863/g.132991  ORF Transcript_33863/g.132991 Transcript_33863/m.132991 type:complete len:166 (+) Transcript_33863:620-1117(+)
MKVSEWAHVHSRASVALEEAEEAVKFLATAERDGAPYMAKKSLDVLGKEIDRLRLAVADDEASDGEIRRRRDIITAFENKQAGLDVQMQNYTGLTSDRAELLGGRIQHGRQGSGSASSMLHAQEQAMKEQDQQIETMSGAARNTKLIAAEIQREVRNGQTLPAVG